MNQTAQKQQQPKFQSIEEEIEWHRKNGSNILIPMTKLEPSEFHVPVIDQVYLSIEEHDAYKRDEKYAPSFQGLNRLSVCAGVQWHPYETRRTDNGNDKLYVAFRAVGGVKKADGSMIWCAANYDLDLEIIKEELEDQYWAKAKKFKKDKSQKEQAEYVEYCVNRDWRQKRRHRHALAESGAKARVLRQLLGVKSAYTKAELDKPFVVVRYVFQPPTNDPAVRRQLIEQSMAGMRSVYGTTALPYYPDKDDYIDIPPPAEAAEESAEDPDPGVESMSPDSPELDTGQEEFPVMDPAQWGDATKTEKVTEIKRVAAHVQYNIDGFEERAGCSLKDMPEAKINTLYRNLCEMVS
jgi:hypothetical protein